MDIFIKHTCLQCNTVYTAKDAFCSSCVAASKRRELGTKICLKCGKEKIRNEFHQTKEGKPVLYTQFCLSCISWLNVKVKFHNKRAVTAGATGDLTLMQWLDILWQSQGHCHYCHMYIGYKFLVLEHTIPIADAGSTTSHNVVPACQRCNMGKGDKPI